MATFSWLTAEENLSPTALTVRAQTVAPSDNGNAANLIWPTVFPRRDRDSVDLDDVTTLDDRPASDRREWNGRGRYVPPQRPAVRQVSIVPIEAYDKIDEYEMQKLNEQTLGNATRIREIIGVRIPQRVDRLASANYRRLELDAIKAWTSGTIIQRNPQNGATFTASFGFEAGRITSALTDWDDAGRNAYNDLLAWYQDAEDASGPGVGVMLRRATLKAILDDAPTLTGGVDMTMAQIEDRITQDLGTAFRFFVNENSVDVFDDGGTAKTRTKVWPAETVAFVPAGQAVGNTEFAPVVRAMQLAAQVPQAGIDVRGQTVFYEESNGGRELTIECQMNALPVPDEGRVFVITVGV